MKIPFDSNFDKWNQCIQKNAAHRLKIMDKTTKYSAEYSNYVYIKSRVVNQISRTIEFDHKTAIRIAQRQNKNVSPYI